MPCDRKKTHSGVLWGYNCFSKTQSSRWHCQHYLSVTVKPVKVFCVYKCVIKAYFGVFKNTKNTCWVFSKNNEDTKYLEKHQNLCLKNTKDGFLCLLKTRKMLYFLLCNLIMLMRQVEVKNYTLVKWMFCTCHKWYDLGSLSEKSVHSFRYFLPKCIHQILLLLVCNNGFFGVCIWRLKRYCIIA